MVKLTHVRQDPKGYRVQMIEDSISPDGIRLSSIQLRYPRFIHSELMTHRVFSRNARSSRAVPTQRLLAEAPFIPEFSENRPGMQAGDVLDAETQYEANALWEQLARECQRVVSRLHELKVHKQWANRPLEWFGWIDVLVTSTDWANFFALRLDSGAQPELQVVAEMMRDVMEMSTPRLLQPGEWHLPYVLPSEEVELDNDTKLVLSTARCARLSIEPFEGEANYEAEKARYERLVVSRPVHASPAEHQATPDNNNAARIGDEYWSSPHLHANFHGWIQHRKLIANESVKEG